MLCGVVAIAVGTEVALAHPAEPLPAGVRLALGAGVVLFVCGTAAALWRATGKTMPARWFVAPAGAVSAFALGATPWVALLLLGAAVGVVSVVEERRHARVIEPAP
jgi:hypothetical protein